MTDNESFSDIMRRTFADISPAKDGKLPLADIKKILQAMYDCGHVEPIEDMSIRLRVYQSTCPCPACGRNLTTHPMHYAHWMCHTEGTCYWADDGTVAFTPEQDIVDDEGNVSLYWMDIRQSIIDGKGTWITDEVQT